MRVMQKKPGFPGRVAGALKHRIIHSAPQQVSRFLYIIDEIEKSWKQAIIYIYKPNQTGQTSLQRTRSAASTWEPEMGIYLCEFRASLVYIAFQGSQGYIETISETNSNNKMK